MRETRGSFECLKVFLFRNEGVEGVLENEGVLTPKHITPTFAHVKPPLSF